MLSYHSYLFGLRKIKRELFDTPNGKEDTNWNFQSKRDKA